jgi:hypothetical protein
MYTRRVSRRRAQYFPTPPYSVYSNQKQRMTQDKFLTLMQDWADTAPNCMKSPLAYQQSEFDFDRFILRKHKLVFSSIEFIPNLNGPNFLLTLKYGGGLETVVYFTRLNLRWIACRILVDGNLDYLETVLARSGFFEIT